MAAQVKAEREARSITFAALQKESLDALHEAAVFDAYCADCEPVSHVTGAPLPKRFRPIKWFRRSR